MGIRHLNTHLREKCSDHIYDISLSQLSGKKIAIKNFLN